MELDNKELEIDAAFIFEKIEEELKECLLEQQVGGDSTEFFNLPDNLRLQEDFDKIIGFDKKCFIKSLMCIFALLLNTKVDTVNKIKTILKIVVTTALKIWSGKN